MVGVYEWGLGISEGINFFCYEIFLISYFSFICISYFFYFTFLCDVQESEFFFKLE